ncbi:unnamed protein product [Ixodes persulcatus]
MVKPMACTHVQKDLGRYDSITLKHSSRASQVTLNVP